ncbi:MAG TPA: hypothetical protein VMP03_07005 [Methylomirabilota bacterium]|nr:hypothetical protein [Methylomirabilota bacterium]
MARGRRRRGFLANVVVPLVGGTAITVAAIVAFAVSSGVPILGPGSGARTADLPRAAIERFVPETVGPPDRDVTPEGVTPGPRVEGRLTRVLPEPRSTAGPREPETQFRRVVVLDGGRFRAIQDRTPVLVRLFGIKAPGFRDVCTDQNGAEWKCGARARAELARLIRNRSVACVIVDDTNPVEPLGRCRVGVYDLSEWMVRYGWADPAEGAGPTLEEAAAEARRKQKGRFGPAPLGVIAG